MPKCPPQEVQRDPARVKSFRVELYHGVRPVLGVEVSRPKGRASLAVFVRDLERFFNPGRRNPPDIDLGFSWRERGLIIRHVYERYGEGWVCMIGTHNAFSMRSEFCEAGKAMGVSEEDLSVVARAVPRTSAESFERALKTRPESRGVGLSEGLWGDLVAVAWWLDGLPRHLSVHCGGVVVSPVPPAGRRPRRWRKQVGGDDATPARGGSRPQLMFPIWTLNEEILSFQPIGSLVTI